MEITHIELCKTKIQNYNVLKDFQGISSKCSPKQCRIIRKTCRVLVLGRPKFLCEGLVIPALELATYADEGYHRFCQLCVTVTVVMEFVPTHVAKGAVRQK